MSAHEAGLWLDKKILNPGLTKWIRMVGLWVSFRKEAILKRCMTLLMRLGVFWLLAACSVPAPAPLATGVPSSSPAETKVAASPTPLETAVVPTPRAGLQATDPSTVKLAAGQPQLVEFFAFW